MFIGGDQYRNDLSNDTIIKCHECGDTNLRYLGTNRAVVENDGTIKPYKCSLGHYTWGAVDDWSILGQSDTLAMPVDDCCCEGIECVFPKSIFVNFSGLIGIQARESKSDDGFEGGWGGQNIHRDMETRDNMPYVHCTRQKRLTPGSCNEPWTYGYENSDGICSSYSGPCRLSQDNIVVHNYTTENQINYNGNTDSCEYNNIPVFCRNNGCVTYITSNPPGQANNGRWTDTVSLNCPNCGAGGKLTLEIDYGPDFFVDQNAPQTINGSPTFLQKIPASQGYTYTNYGGTLFFIVHDSWLVERNPACSGECPKPSDPYTCDVSFSRETLVIYRKHPTSDPKAKYPPVEEWTLEEWGKISNNMSYKVIGGCGTWVGEYEDDCGYPVVFPNSNNFCLDCSCEDCNENFALDNCGDEQSSRRIWPFRVPTRLSLGYNDTTYQLLRDTALAAYYPTAGECDCVSNECKPSSPPPIGTTGPPGLPPPIYPEWNEICCTGLYYPDCLSQGTYKCKDVDAKYRIPCENPKDFFITSSIDQLTNSLLEYRYTVVGDGINSVPGVVFNPIFAGSVENAHKWTFPPHPDFAKCGAPNVGYVSRNSPNYVPPTQGFPANESAGGVTSAFFWQLFAGPGENIQQPHCLRRVKNPNLYTGSDNDHLYGVNTSDISNQTIILDRYYKTGESFDFLWHDVLLGKDEVANQNFISNQGDLGLNDNLNSRYFPYPFIANSGSIEEPEIIAIIHSVSGVGGQIAFQTFPVSYDSDILIDVEYDGHPVLSRSPDFIYEGRCPFKHRVTVHGYGVMYPLIDDPMWKEDDLYEYPVFLKGKNYEIGDKIEFRCWKSLHDNEGKPLNNPENESIWKEECRELVIATATITETDANGGILWYEFDETDDNDNLLISVGNCPCSYDKCTNPKINQREADDIDPEAECLGCLSRFVYESGHFKLDALPDGFPGFPAEVCTFLEGYISSNGMYKKTICNPYTDPGDCDETCQSTALWHYNIQNKTYDIWPVLLNENNCSSVHCTCFGASYGSGAYPDLEYLDVLPGDCKCSVQPGDLGTNDDFINFYIGPHSPLQGENSPEICFPLNRTWEFYANNYAISACSGEEISSYERPYYDPDANCIIPPKKAQVKYQWLPNVNKMKQAIENNIDFWEEAPQNNALDPAKRELFIKIKIDEFLFNHEACNPLKLDRFDRSYKFPLANLTGEIDKPCRIQNNYQGVGTLFVKYSDGDGSIDIIENKNSDNYCRVYGFYQQRQPTCDVIYRGQYIMRAAQKHRNWYQEADCEPIISDITITLSKKESKFDISMGAPYNQDYLIPENLPEPVLGPDGKLEVTADPWNYPSLVGDENPRLFNHGFFEPNRYDSVTYKEIPNESEKIAGVPDEIALTRTYQINAIFLMPDVDGKDYTTIDIDNGIIDKYIQGTWDLPDPRSNVRTGSLGLELGDSCINPVYPGVELPSEGLRNSFINQCPYPWEDISCDEDCDNYCMFENNSAEIVLNEIVECEYCAGSEVVTLPNFILPDPLPPNLWQILQLGRIVHYTVAIPIERIDIDDDKFQIHSFIFIAYANSDNMPSVADFIEVLAEYVSVWISRVDIDFDLSDDKIFPGKLLEKILFSDIHREILWNMMFEGAANEKLSHLTKIEIYRYIEEYEVDDEDNVVKTNFGMRKLFSEDRCEYPTKGGSIKSLTVQNGGKGYAFEIEERVAPELYVLYDILTNEVLEGVDVICTFIPSNLYRRREVYQLDTIVVNSSDKKFTNLHIGKIFGIRFTDLNFKRSGVVYDAMPLVSISKINEETNEILEFDIVNPGGFYKFVGTGEHRAYPVSMVVNNYWEFQNKDKTQQVGRYAKLRPVIGVDPNDLATYGKIKRVEVDYGGIDYVLPEVYWTIDTKAGTYNNSNDLTSGLDIQHLVNPGKYCIYGDGLNSKQLVAYFNWMNIVDNPADLSIIDNLFFPEKLGRDPFIRDSDGIPIGNSDYNGYENSIKYYLHTGADNNIDESGIVIDRGKPIKWENRVKSWSTVIQSGLCPFGSSGLLDRVYEMALVEENLLYDNQPIVSRCIPSVCNDIIDRNVAIPPDYFIPNNEDLDAPLTSGVCDTYTAYDAHRFPIDYLNCTGGDNISICTAFATTRPWVRGCNETIPFQNDQQRNIFCYANLDFAGGSLQTNGFGKWPNISSSQDKCYNAEYSMYLEIGKYVVEGPNPDIVPVSRVKTITYKMQDPITMTISYNDDSVLPFSSGCDFFPFSSG